MQFSEIHKLHETDSTNEHLRRLWQENTALPDRTLVITDNQLSGKGRLGRSWQTPRGEAIAVSLLVRDFATGNVGGNNDGGSDAPAHESLSPGWLPLITGSAVVSAINPLLPSGTVARVKWPNDVHVAGAKVCGILCEMLPDGAIIVGVGLNIFMPKSQLPTERAGSLLALGADLRGYTNTQDAGAEKLVEEILTRFSDELENLIAAARTNPQEVRERVAKESDTLTKRVRAELPGGGQIVGTAVALDSDGALLIAPSSATSGVTMGPAANSATVAAPKNVRVSAGDVWHLREADKTQ